MEDGGHQGGVERVDAWLGPVVVVQEEVPVEPDPSGGEPLDVQVGEQNILTSVTVVRAVAGEDRPVVVGRLIGQKRQDGGQGEPDRARFARLLVAIANVVGVVDVSEIARRADTSPCKDNAAS